MPTLIDHRSVQRFLAQTGHYKGRIDGDYGRASTSAGRAYVARSVPRYMPSWPDSRVRVAVEQSLLKANAFFPFQVDGLAGPATQASLEKWQDYLTFRAGRVSGDLGEQIAKAPIADRAAPTIWPHQSDLRKFYGEVGQNQTKLKSPYPLFLDWELSDQIEHFSCHEKVHDPMLRVMQRVLSGYGPEAIHELGLDQFGGCLNVRRMRNGSSWSTHAWGIATDWDADRNTLRETSRTARLARPEYALFLDLWEEEGFVSLGRERNFDWMHLQAARL